MKNKSSTCSYPAHLLAIHIAEKYTNITSQRPDYRGGIPIARLRKIEDYVRAHLAKAFQSRRWLSWRS
jgi:hypothetical protein